jgi:hypothetical protein
MTTSTDQLPGGLPKSRATINFHVDADVHVEVGVLDTGVVTLEIGAPVSSARLNIFAPGHQALWALLVEAERQLAHLANEPPVDPTVVGGPEDGVS